MKVWDMVMWTECSKAVCYLRVDNSLFLLEEKIGTF